MRRRHACGAVGAQPLLAFMWASATRPIACSSPRQGRRARRQAAVLRRRRAASHHHDGLLTDALLLGHQILPTTFARAFGGLAPHARLSDAAALASRMAARTPPHSRYSTPLPCLTHSYAYLYHQKDMLEDHKRTGAYYNACMQNRAQFAGKVVLDVGTGSGILAIFAARAGAAAGWVHQGRCGWAGAAAGAMLGGVGSVLCHLEQARPAAPSSTATCHLLQAPRRCTLLRPPTWPSLPSAW